MAPYPAANPPPRLAPREAHSPRTRPDNTTTNTARHNSCQTPAGTTANKKEYPCSSLRRPACWLCIRWQLLKRQSVAAALTHCRQKDTETATELSREPYSRLNKQHRFDGHSRAVPLPTPIDACTDWTACPAQCYCGGNMLTHQVAYTTNNPAPRLLCNMHCLWDVQKQGQLLRRLAFALPRSASS